MALIKIEKILFFLCLIFLPTQLGKHFFISESRIFSIPIDYLSLVIYFWDLLAVSLVFVFFINNNFKRINFFSLNILLIFIVLQSTSLFSGLNPIAGLFRLEQFLITGFFGFYLANQNIEKIKKTLITSLSIGLFFQTGLSIFQVLFGKTLGFWILGERSFSVNTYGIARFDFLGNVVLRAYGTFPHPNVQAGFYLIVLGIISGLSKTALFLILPTSLVIFLSFSRAAILVFVLESFLLFKDLIIKRYKFLILVILIATPLLLIRFLSVFNFDVISLVRRKELTDVALTGFISHPVLGIGLNSFINFISESELISGSMRFLQPVHNIFLLSLAETGIVGFVGFLILILVPFYFCFKKRKTAFGFSLLICWILIFILGSFDHYFLTLAQGQRIFFLVWGLSLGFWRNKALN